jgi:hypothetical protein
MRAKISLLVMVLLSSGWFGCNPLSSGGPPSCPPTTVVLDAGVDGLPDVGEYCAHEICEWLCGGGMSTCRREADLVLSCWPGCI